MDILGELTEKIVAFRDAREWAPFHTLPNLAQALAIEAAELSEVFLWRRLDEREERRLASEEVGDVLIYALLVCYELGLGPADVIRAKLASVEKRYPIATSRGTALKPKEKPGCP